MKVKFRVYLWPLGFKGDRSKWIVWFKGERSRENLESLGKYLFDLEEAIKEKRKRVNQVKI
ncbi:hypothetical protein D3H64_03500 [Atopobacter sp. AH10]|nr:hypothetical protein D3H64_03500 [Atopobacter sp. AH10]